MKKMHQGQDNKGFTLIELLVVIAIIAILSTVVMAGLTSARQKGRDAKRVSDIRMLQKALDLYNDTCGGYPMIPSSGTGAYADIGAGGLDAGVSDGTCTSSGETLGTFMAVMPVDPGPTVVTYQYCSTAEGAAIGAASCDSDQNASYQITFTLEGGTGSLGAGARTATPSGIQ